MDYVLSRVDAVRRRRHEADPRRYPAQMALYRWLDATAEPVARFGSSRDVVGPEIRVYRLGPAAQAQLSAEYGALPALWWADAIPAKYRATVNALAAAGAPDGDSAVRGADGKLAPWVRSLAPVYESRIAPFAEFMAVELEATGHSEDAERFTRANLAMLPDDAESFRISELRVRPHAASARPGAIVESTLTVLEREDPRARALRATFDGMRSGAGHANSQ